jgi:hypothetical protein
MKIKYFLTIYILFAITINSWGQWQEQNCGVNEDLWDICFIDSLYGWSVGSNSLIIKTTNGGNNWNSVKVSIPTGEGSKIRFVDRYNGFLLSYGKLYTSFNGGDVWSLLDTVNNLNIYDFFFLDQNHGWISLLDSWFTQKQATVALTSNRGKNWQIVYNDTGNPAIGFEAIDFLNDTYGVGSQTSHQDVSATKFFSTTDGGKNWKNVGNYSSAIYNFRIMDSSKIIGGGVGLAISTDKGITWDSDNNFKNYIKDLSNSDRATVWFLYYSNDLKEFQVYYTTPTFIFNKILFPSGIIPNAIDNYKDKYCWVAGNGGKIFFYKRNISDVKVNYSKPFEFLLYQNYPNPFNPNTIIKYSIPFSPSPLQGEGIRVRLVTLKVYDLLGREVSTLVNEEKQPGNYEVKFNGAGLPSGVYYYRLFSGTYSETKKMLLVK